MIIHHQVLSCANCFRPFGLARQLLNLIPRLAPGCILAASRSRRPAIFSSGSAGARCPETTRIQPPRKVTEKTASPIFRNPPESLPPAKILLRGPANFRAPGGPARTRRDQTRPLRCNSAVLRSCPAPRCKPPPAGGRFPVELRSGLSDLREPLCPGAAAQIRRTCPYPHQDASTREIMQGPTLWFSMIGKGGPLCARTGMGHAKASRPARPKPIFLAMVWRFINGPVATTKNINARSTSKASDKSVRPTLTPTLSRPSGWRAFPWAGTSATSTRQREQAYRRPRNERAHGLPGRIVFGQAIESRSASRQSPAPGIRFRSSARCSPAGR